MPVLPMPRPVAPNIGIGVPHVDLYADCARLWRALERAEAEGRSEAAAVKRRLDLDVDYSDNWNVRLYASAIHIFAAMTAEAAMNTYAVARFGEEPFDRCFRYGPPAERLRAILHYLPNVDLSDASEPIVIAKRLFGVRNALVHPHSGEAVYDHQGKSNSPVEVLEISKATAKLALDDLQKFLDFLSNVDADVGGFLFAFFPRDI